MWVEAEASECQSRELEARSRSASAGRSCTNPRTRIVRWLRQEAGRSGPRYSLVSVYRHSDRGNGFPFRNNKPKLLPLGIHDPERQRRTVFEILRAPGRSCGRLGRAYAFQTRRPPLRQPMGAARAFGLTNRETPLSKDGSARRFFST